MCPVRSVTYVSGRSKHLQGIRQKSSSDVFFAVWLGAELTVNPGTGSLLIRHSGPPDLIERLATEYGTFDLRRPAPKTAGSRRHRKAVSGAAVDVLDATAVGLTGLGLYQLASGQALGSAAEHFWSAYGALRNLNRPTVALAFAGLGCFQLARGQWLSSAASLFYYALVAHELAESAGKEAEAPAGEAVTPTSTVTADGMP